MLIFLCSALVLAEPIRPHTVWVQLHEARLISEYEKEHEEAIGLYDALLDGLGPSDFSYSDLWYWKGVTYLKMNQYDLAMDAFERSDTDVFIQDRNRAKQAIEESILLKNRVVALPNTKSPWVSLSEDDSIWGMSVDESISTVEGFELYIRTIEPVVSLQIHIESWDGRIWSHAVNLIEGDSVMPLRFGQLRPAVPKGTAVRTIRINCQTPAGGAAKLNILEAVIF